MGDAEGAVDVTPYHELNVNALNSLIQYLKSETDRTHFSHFSFILKAFDTANTVCSGLINKLNSSVIEYFLTDKPHIKATNVSVFDNCLYIELKIR